MPIFSQSLSRFTVVGSFRTLSTATMSTEATGCDTSTRPTHWPNRTWWPARTAATFTSTPSGRWSPTRSCWCGTARSSPRDSAASRVTPSPVSTTPRLSARTWELISSSSEMTLWLNVVRSVDVPCVFSTPWQNLGCDYLIRDPAGVKPPSWSNSNPICQQCSGYFSKQTFEILAPLLYSLHVKPVVLFSPRTKKN